MTSVRLNRLHYPVTTLGPGTRLGIWVQGCSIECRGCVSRDTWDPDAAEPMSVAEVIDRANHLCDGPVDGVTVTGGEPFDQPEGLQCILEGLRGWLDGRSNGDADLLAYTGYELDDVIARAPGPLAFLDAVIAGPYIASQPTAAAWWGSSNQTLVPLTARGRSRYATTPPSDPGKIQVDVDSAGRVWLIGVPRVGVLQKVEASLRAAGVHLEGVSWRP